MKEDLKVASANLNKGWKGGLKPVSPRALHCAEFEEGPINKTGSMNTTMFNEKYMENHIRTTNVTMNKRSSSEIINERKTLPDFCKPKCREQHYLKYFRLTILRRGRDFTRKKLKHNIILEINMKQGVS